MSKVKVLLAEDEASLGMIVKESLETRDFLVFLAEDGEQAVEIYKKEQPDILVLDVMMPKKDVLEGFHKGGNDYLKKPFSMEELIVRIKALLDRIEIKSNVDHINIGKYVFNLTKQTLEIDNNLEQLTHREAELLFYLFEKKNEILDRSFILNKLWGNDDFFNARSMDVFISKLRKKLKKDETIQILNVRGFGYKLIC